MKNVDVEIARFLKVNPGLMEVTKSPLRIENLITFMLFLKPTTELKDINAYGFDIEIDVAYPPSGEVEVLFVYGDKLYRDRYFKCMWLCRIDQYKKRHSINQIDAIKLASKKYSSLRARTYDLFYR